MSKLNKIQGIADRAYEEYIATRLMNAYGCPKVARDWMLEVIEEIEDERRHLAKSYR